VVCLTQNRISKGSGHASVSIRFHRGGLSHLARRYLAVATGLTVSIRFHRGGLSHGITVPKAELQEFGFNPLSSRWSVSRMEVRIDEGDEIVSIRFHRGGLSHEKKQSRYKARLSFNPLSSRWSVSPTLLVASPPSVSFNPLSSRWSVSPD